MMLSTKSLTFFFALFAIVTSCPFQNMDKDVIKEILSQESSGLRGSRKLQGGGGGGGRQPGGGGGGGGGGNVASSAPSKLSSKAPSLTPSSSRPSFSSTIPPTPAPVTVKPTNAPTIRPTTALPTASPSLGAFCLKTNGVSVPKNATGTCVAYKSILQDFQAAIPTSAFGQANLFGQTIRLAFHDAGEADITTTDLIGPDGCLSSSSDNAGLIEVTSLVFKVLEPIWQKYCNLISRADFWVLAAKFAIEAAEPTKTIVLPFKFGRKDNLNCNAGAGRLPRAQLGIPELNKVFVTQMGLTLTDAVTLLGAHTVGHVHTANSGFGRNGNLSADNLLNAWDTTPNVFDNRYYASIVTPWASTTPNGPTKNLWTHGANNNIMLNADIAMGCNITINSLTAFGVPGQRCPGGGGAATLPTTIGSPSTLTLVNNYARSNANFLRQFALSFASMTTVGYAGGNGASTKLGTLTSITC